MVSFTIQISWSEIQSLCGLFCVTWFWISCHSLEQINALLCEFFHGSSNYLLLSICSHTWSSWKVFHQYEFFRESANFVIGWISCCTWSSWMVYHQYVSFHVSSNYICLSTCSHTGSSWMVYHLYGFFMDLQMTQGFTFVITPSAAKWFLTSVNSFIFFKSPDIVDMFSHWEQLNGLSPVWFLSWVFKYPLFDHL